jgi:hypothetical protein
MTRRGAMLILLAGAALTSGCARDPAVEVRAVGVSAREAATDDQLALGRAALAMGNVGIALQQFRHSLRLHPGSVEALSGIALCYDHMGRADLSRRYYEEALAFAPADMRLLRMYAASLARHGAVGEAQAVISEIALRSKAPAVQWVIEQAPAAPAAAVAPVSSVALVPSARPQQVATAATVRSHAAAAKVRLERVSLGEIALITSGEPLWKALPAAAPVRSVRLLNAARRQGLAARHREQLRGAGWRSVAIGDAPHVRTSSLVLYPAGQRGEARRLADSLRIAAMRPQARADILILLGRDRG